MRDSNKTDRQLRIERREAQKSIKTPKKDKKKIPIIKSEHKI